MLYLGLTSLAITWRDCSSKWNIFLFSQVLYWKLKNKNIKSAINKYFLNLCQNGPLEVEDEVRQSTLMSELASATRCESQTSSGPVWSLSQTCLPGAATPTSPVFLTTNRRWEDPARISQECTPAILKVLKLFRHHLCQLWLDCCIKSKLFYSIETSSQSYIIIIIIIIINTWYNFRVGRNPRLQG